MQFGNIFLGILLPLGCISIYLLGISLQYLSDNVALYNIEARGGEALIVEHT